jgi:phosphotransferase system HPr (HPr) family protein
MIARTVIVQNPAGLHARLASLFCALAKQFASKVVVRTPGRYITARNILDLMAANVRQGDSLTIHCDGPDEQAALQALTDFINNLQE